MQNSSDDIHNLSSWLNGSDLSSGLPQDDSHAAAGNHHGSTNAFLDNLLPDYSQEYHPTTDLSQLQAQSTNSSEVSNLLNWQNDHASLQSGDAHSHLEQIDFASRLNRGHLSELHSDPQTMSSEARADGMNVSVFHSSSQSDSCTYTTIDDYGSIYKHTPEGNSHYEGYVKGRTVYNASNCELGYGGRDGKVYDRFDHVVGWVDACGDVYNAAGEKVYHTTKGVVGGAAYLLDVYYGGVQ